MNGVSTGVKQRMNEWSEHRVKQRMNEWRENRVKQRTNERSGHRSEAEDE